MSTHTALLQLDPTKLSISGDVIEIGTQRHRGKGSSWSLSQLARRFGVAFHTVDLSPTVYQYVKDDLGTEAHCADGAAFLAEYSSPISILYLDNFDILYSETHAHGLRDRMGQQYLEVPYDFSVSSIQNRNAILCHFNQLLAAERLLTEQCIVAIDDTMLRNGMWWGKGALVVPYLLTQEYAILTVADKGVVLGRSVRSWSRITGALA